ncbi:dnaJ homolog subfamily C member 13-like isoform X1 [Macrosteles quadrilineatus]|uniref:dnaJ homolog subfamily C member 13-like isoform X1 n=1 Tax=Macrosteles quadrilineatus TaxID=74068 RepID=UPI0023E1F256|nr:dnaJ homolog subfamily C member 13-like isoform X1 [Macrosteles quadrilineatus]
MMPLPENEDVVCYFVIKHSWKGKYKRIFSIGTTGITTYKPQTLEVTNRWLYADVTLLKVSPSSPQEFMITARKEGNKKGDTMRFSTEHRAQLLSEAFKSRHMFHERWTETQKYEAFKHHWSGTRLPVLLEVTPISVDQLDTATSQILASYCFKDIQTIQLVKDVAYGFVIVSGSFGRKHMFISQNRDEVIKKIQEMATFYLALKIDVASEEISIDEFANLRFGKYSEDEFITSVVEFTVEKIQTNRHTDAERRLLCLSQACLIERDVQTYNAVTLRPLVDVTALIRCDDNSQLFTIEYADGSSKTYLTTNRDSLLATLLDGVRGSGNMDVHVKMKPTARGKRMGPFYATMEEEVESLHISYLKEVPARTGKQFCEMLERFNTNVPYSGLLHQTTQDGLFTDNKEKMIQQALESVMARGDLEPTDMDVADLECLFHTLRRLIASRAGFSAFTQLKGFRESLGVKVTKALRRNHEAVTHAAIDTVCALMKPMYSDCDLRQEQLNKSSLLSSPKFLQSLLDMWVRHVECNTGTLVVTAMLDFLTFALCVPFSETTEGKHFDTLLEMVAQKGRTLFKLFQHTSLTVLKGAGLVMRAVIEEGDAGVAAKMQELALCEGALPRHLLIALFTSGSEQRHLAHRQLSRHLVGLWVTGNSCAMELLNRCMPVGLLQYLESKDRVPDGEAEDVLQIRDNLKLAQDHAAKHQRNHISVALDKHRRILEKHVEHVLEHWGTSLSNTLGIERKDEKPRDRPVVLRKRRERIKSEANWKLFYYMFNHDHKLANLIWNHKTREELREALEKEVRLFTSDRDLPGNVLIAWNHSEFEVVYRSLADEVCIDGYYLNLMLELNSVPETLTRNAKSFFNNLYHKFLINPKIEMKVTCIQVMTLVYGHYHEDIGPFSDTKVIVGMLDRCVDRTERDRLLLFLGKLILNKQNVKAVLDAHGVQILVDLLTLAHLHTSRAVVPTQTNVIEAGQGMSQDNEKEWYYSVGAEKKGPFTFQKMKELWSSGELTTKSKCWAQGMDSWRLPQNIPQIKWCLLARGSAVLNETELATVILNMLIHMCQFYPSRDQDEAVIWPIPRIKRILTSDQCLPHVVQLLLTFDPTLVEKVATLLCLVAEYNAHAANLYTTGVFYFILMYTGSNVLPIAKFLQMTHIKQSFRMDEANSSELMQRSVLGQLLPEAMVYYLENHGADKFAQIFLGEYDTPEAIWNSEMRRLLIEKIALHLADYSPRLRGNTRAPYGYIAIPAVRYPQLEHELFCNIYYLRHLCDTKRFPNWPIKNPVGLLKDVLQLWKAEVEKKPPEMSVDDAYEALGLARGQHHEEALVRKTYYKLAQTYHPDKNPEGKETFLSVNRAYEFLCSNKQWTENGPNPHNIVLILQTQSILFHNHSTELQPYKYAGYSQLIKTIQMETADAQLFSKPAMLLSAATELAHHTINCSVLNAEELNREGGFQVLLAAFSRCVSVLSRSSAQKDMNVQVCTHCVRCFSAAAQFPACRDTFAKLPQLIEDLVRIFHFKNLTKLCSEVVVCVRNLAADPRLQQSLLNNGVLWYLLTFMFSYDYTLEECGVERSEDANNQEVANRLAKLSVSACARLGGYEKDSPNNAVVKSILGKLLTPYLAGLFAEDQPEKVLKLLTSNSENPYLMWDNTTRAELQDFLETQCSQREYGPLTDVEFAYSSHATELVIGNVFIRLYNSQPTFPIKNAKGFLLDLLEFVRMNQPSPNDESDTERNDRVTMALHALGNVVNSNPGLEMQCIGHFRLLFPLLSLDSCRPIQQSTLAVISAVTRNQECISDIAASNVLVYLFLVLYSVPDSQLLTLDILYALVSNTAVVKDFLAKGGFIYLLDLLFTSSSPETQVKCADLLGRLCADKLSGPRVRLALDKFLPPAMCDALRDSPSQCPGLLDTNQENPELVWDDECRKKVAAVISNLARRHYVAQRTNHSAVLTLPETSVLCADDGSSRDVVVGGVYLRLFNNNPGWTLRKPRDFLSSLLDTSIKQINKENPDFDLLELVITSLINLLQCHPMLADQVPSLGYIPRICSLLPGGSSRTSHVLLRILHQLSISDVCIGSMGQTEILKPMQSTMKEYSELVVLGCDMMARLFLANKDTLVKQALDVDLVPYLLTLLDGRLDRTENASRSKALVVKALKSMSQSVLYGSQVNAVLNNSKVWASYSQQNHDLFITNTPTQNYLTGVPMTAGYLTQGSSQPLPTSPPPLDPDNS